MTIRFRNLAETEVEDLRAFEDRHPEECILAITEAAFDGLEWISLILTAVDIITSLASLILSWKKKEDNGAQLSEAEITIIQPGGNSFTAKLKDVSEDTLLTILKQTCNPH